MHIIHSPVMEEAAGGAAATVAASGGGTTAAATTAATTATSATTAAATGAATATTPVAPANTAPAAWHSDWLKPDGSINHESYNRLPDNLKSLAPSLANAKSIDDVMTKLSNLSTLAGKKALAPLPSDAPAEAVAERNALLRTINGVPEKPEGYGITKPADLPDFAWNQKAMEAAVAIAHKNNISPSALKELVESQAVATREQMVTLKQDEANFWTAQDKAFKDALTKDGIPYDKALDMATRAAKQFGVDPEGPMFKYAEVRLALQRAGLATMEPTLKTGETPMQPGNQDFNKLAADVIHNKNNPEHDAYWNRGPKGGNHPQNAEVKKKVIMWQAEAARLAQTGGKR